MYGSGTIVSGYVSYEERSTRILTCPVFWPARSGNFLVDVSREEKIRFNVPGGLTYGEDRIQNLGFPGDIVRRRKKIRPGLPGDVIHGEEKIKALRPRRVCPQEVGYTDREILGYNSRGKESRRGLEKPSDFAREKQKVVVATCPGTQPVGRRRSPHARGPSPREGDCLNMPGDPARGMEKGRSFDVPSDFARGRDTIFVISCPGNRPVGRRSSHHARGHSPREGESLSMPGDTARGMEKGKNFDCPSDVARGKDTIFVSTYPGNRPVGRRRSQHARGHSPRDGESLNMPGDTARGREKVSTCPGTQPAGRRKVVVS